jgi:VIT1/CCC1 family predicted Fe2+/Mn2+ transporter
MASAGSSNAEPLRPEDEANSREDQPLSSVGTQAHADGSAPAEAPGHEHRDVSGGWLRPSVFGAMDGLVTNVSLIAGVGGAKLPAHTIILTGLAGLAAGAFSMAAGEYVSVSSQNELVESEVAKERYELEHNSQAEQEELAAMYRLRGVAPELADEVARQLSANPEQALQVHVREELGVDHEELPSPVVAAGASLLTFAIGALIPLLPYLVGLSSLAVSIGLAALAAFIGGGLVARITARPFLRGALRQLALAALAAALTYGIGTLAGGRI